MGVSKISALILKKMSGKDWGDWTLSQMTWTLQNISCFEGAKLPMIENKPLLDALCSVVRGSAYDGMSKKWAASALWDVAFHQQLKKKAPLTVKPIHDALRDFDPPTAEK